MVGTGGQAGGPERGQSRRRGEDERFLTGRGRYVDDLAEPGQLHGHVLRSPVAHGVITALDVAAARALPGVVAIIIAADLAAEAIGALPCLAGAVATAEPLVTPPHFALASDRVRHVGDPVAFIVAESVEAARDAAEAIVVAYDEQPAAPDLANAAEPGAPPVWEHAPDNVAFRFEKGDRAAVDAAFAAAAHVVELTLSNNRIVAAPLEPRAAIGSFDPATETFRLVLTGQGVHSIRNQLADSVFRVPRDRIELIAPDVGGGFGAKNVLYPEWILVLFAARRLGRPVKWVSERSEDFLSSAQARANLTRGRLALDTEGRFTALAVETDADMGAYLSELGPLIPTNSASSAMGGVYAIPSIHLAVRGIYTHTVPVDAYRGAGKPEANYIVERLADEAARQLGIDPAELRRRNMISRFPYPAALGPHVERGLFAAGLDAVAEAADVTGFPARRAEAASRGQWRGLGQASFLETARGAIGEWAGIRFETDGTVMLLVGTQSNGQGHETSFPQIASDLLGLPWESFRYHQADTRDVVSGQGHGGARSLHQGGTALVRAIEASLAKARRIAAHLLQSAPDDLVYEGGAFHVPESGRRIALLAVAEAARDESQLPAGMQPGLDSAVQTGLDLITFPNGCHVAEVEVDPETGVITLLRYTAVDDYGTLINPLLTEGQIHGGLAQGIGQAIHEHTVYESGSGQILTASFMDYAIPRAADLPDFDIRFAGVASEANPLGVKGSGQAGCIAAPQTIVNAVMDALAPHGVATIDMPLTPSRVWAAIQGARAK